jgi:hypothetical protein
MALLVGDTRLRLQALAYVIKLYDELTAENGAPTLGTQNQVVEFVLADPDLCRAVAEWAATTDIDEASTATQRRPPQDDLYRRVRTFFEKITGQPYALRAPQSEEAPPVERGLIAMRLLVTRYTL